MYGHLPHITKTIQIRRTRHAGHCWISKDELISHVLPWTSSHGRAKARRPARTYVQQLCEDTGCCPEDLLKAMNDRERWRERVRDNPCWWHDKMMMMKDIKKLEFKILVEYLVELEEVHLISKFHLTYEIWTENLKKTSFKFDTQIFIINSP